jgi:hypothetical protein
MMSKQTAKAPNVTTLNGDPDDPVSPVSRRPFRAADVLTGTIDKKRQEAARPRKQISAQLDAHQVRLLGELHARLNATAERRIEKSDLVGLGIELLAAVLAAAEREFDPASDGASRASGKRGKAGEEIRDVDDIRSYLRTHVREYVETQR